MSYSLDYFEPAYFGDLFELTIEEAAALLHEGLWDPEQATADEIKQAIIDAINTDKLIPVRGSLTKIGKYSSLPPVLDAYKVAEWAEKNGLELESNGAWASYSSLKFK